MTNPKEYLRIVLPYPDALRLPKDSVEAELFSELPLAFGTFSESSSFVESSVHRLCVPLYPIAHRLRGFPGQQTILLDDSLKEELVGVEYPPFEKVELEKYLTSDELARGGR